MALNTSEKFLLLIQHPLKSKFILPEQMKRAGFIGSILLDLANNKNIEIEDNKLIIKSNDTDLSPVHKTVLELIETSPKIRKVKTWVSRLSRKSGKFQKKVLLELEEKGNIRMHNKQFLGFKYYKTELVRNGEREKIIKDIREIVFKNKEITGNNALLLGLIEACRLYKTVCYTKEERKICKRKVKEIMKSDLISQGVDKVIKEMQAAIVMAVVGAAAGSTAANS